MAVNANGIHFDVTASANQAEREFAQLRAAALRDLDSIEDKAERTRDKLSRLSGRELFKLDIAGLDGDKLEREINKALNRDALRAFSEETKRADTSLRGFGNASREARGGAGQFIEALAQGDPGELLGEIAQQGGKAGLAVAGFTLVAAGAVVGLAAMTAALIENVRETDKLARETKLASTQIQALQTYANLTGESVDDLAKNYKKLGPEIKEIERRIRESGAAIDNDLRVKVQQAQNAWEFFKIEAQGALNTVGKELLPVVTYALQELTGTIASVNFKALAADAAAFFIDVIVYAKEAKYEVTKLASGLSNLFIPDPNVQTVGEAFDKMKRGAVEIGEAAKGNVSGIRGEVEQRIQQLRDEAGKGKGRSVPRIGGGGGGGGGKKDITELELAIRKLRVEQDEATRALNGTAEAAERLFLVTRKLQAKEKERAQTLLPNERAAAMAEIQNRENIALEEYGKRLKEIADEGLKPIEELSKRINEENAKFLEWIERQEEASLQLRNALIDARLEREGILLDQQEARLERLRQLGATEATIRGEQLQISARAEELAFERRKEQHQRDLQQVAESFEDEEMRLELQKAINRRFEAEQYAHEERMRAIRGAQKQEAERANPLSARSLLGENFANNLEGFDGDKLAALSATAADHFHQMSEAAGNFGTIAGEAFGSFASGIGQAVESFVLLGTTGPAALKKLTAQVLAQVASQAAVKAVFELAEGFAMLFVNPAAAAAHFKAAALYGAVAVTAGVAGRAIAGDSFSRNSGGAGGAGATGGARRDINIEQPLRTGAYAQDPQLRILRVEYAPGVIVREVTADYKRNGTARQTLRADMGDEALDIV